MNSEENQENFVAQVPPLASVHVSDVLNRIEKASMMLENVSQSEDGSSSVDNIRDIGFRNEPLRLEDATESKLDEMMDQLLKILDETITIFGEDEAEDDDSVYYFLSDQNDKNEDVQKDVILDDTIVTQPNVPKNDAVGHQSEAEDFSSTKNLKGKRNGLNEFTESFMIVLMLFSLYFLLSSLI